MNAFVAQIRGGVHAGTFISYFEFQGWDEFVALQENHWAW